MRTKTSRDKALEWYKKYTYLHKLINDLEEKNEPGSSMTSFMLNVQLIEYRLKKEINLLNHYINSHANNSGFMLRVKSIEEIEAEKVTFGNLIKELNHFDCKQLSKLKVTLKNLLYYRNFFIHKLFNIGTLEEAEKAARKGNKLATEAWNEMEEISYFTSGDYDREKYGDD